MVGYADKNEKERKIKIQTNLIDSDGRWFIMAGNRERDCSWAEEFTKGVGGILLRHMGCQEGSFCSDFFRDGAETDIERLCSEASIYIRYWKMSQLKLREFEFEAGIAESNGSKKPAEWNLRRVIIKVMGNWEGGAEIETKITY